MATARLLSHISALRDGLAGWSSVGAYTKMEKLMELTAQYNKRKSVRINSVSWVVIVTMKQILKNFGLITMVFRMIILADGIILASVLL